MSLVKVPYPFQRVSRQTNPQAAIFDPSIVVLLDGKQITGVIKPWADPNPPAGMVSYPYLKADGSMGSMQMVGEVAGKLNLPGHPDYQHYSPAPSGATLNGTSFQVVSLEAAQGIAKDLGLTNDSILDPMSGFSGVFAPAYPAGDARRAYSVKVANGTEVSVFQLLAAKNANGIGAPGHWDQTGPAPVWVTDFPAPAADAVTLPDPVGTFPVGATVVPGNIMTGGLPMLSIPDAPSSSDSSATGGFADADRADVKRIRAILEKLYGSLVQ